MPQVPVDMEGYSLQVTVSLGAVELYDVTITGLSGEILPDMVDRMVTALEAAGGEALTPSFDEDTGVLTVAEEADGLGNHTLTVVLMDAEDAVLTDFVSAVTHEGNASDPLTVQFVTLWAKVMAVLSTYKAAQIDGDLVRRGDMKAYIANDGVAADGYALLDDAGTRWKIVEADIIKPGTEILLYKLQLRR